MPRQSTQQDRNFDDLAPRFGRNIYGGLKGRIRLAVLNRDFAEYLPIAPYVPLTPEKTLRILDAGGGQGQFSLPLAGAGHTLTLCDISAQMLAVARTEAEAMGLRDRVNFVLRPVQEMSADPAEGGQYDLILCHALLEWVAEPWLVLTAVLSQLRVGGHLSLIFYNQHGLEYKNLLRANFKKIQSADYSSFRGSLTPINPLIPNEVQAQLQSRGLHLICHSGIRVFYDYILDPVARNREPDTLVALELDYSRRDPYRALGRYVHMLVKKTP